MPKFDPSTINWRVPWWPVRPEDDSKTAAEFYREIPAGHVLFGHAVQTIGYRQDCDDVLFYLGELTPQFAVVHLTYVKETQSEWPQTTLYNTLDEWIQQCMIPDAKDFES